MATKSIGTLKAALILDTRGFMLGFQNAASALKSATAGMGRMGAAAAGAAAVFTAAGTAVAMMRPAFESVDRQSKLAHRLDITGEAAQRLSAVAKATNTDVNMLAKAMLKMGTTVGTGGKSLDKRFIEVATAVDAIKDPVARANTATKIFGKEGAMVLEAIGGSGGNIAKVSRTIDRFGLSISRVDANRVERANDALGQLGTVYDGLKDKLATKLAPTVELWANGAIAALERLHNTMIGVLATQRSISHLFAGIGAVTDVASAIESSRNGGSGRVPDILGGDSIAKQVKPGAFERNSMEAVRAVQNAGGDGTTAIVAELKKAVQKLTVLADDAIKDSLDKDGIVFREGRI